MSASGAGGRRQSQTMLASRVQPLEGLVARDEEHLLVVQGDDVHVRLRDEDVVEGHGGAHGCSIRVRTKSTASAREPIVRR